MHFIYMYYTLQTKQQSFLYNNQYWTHLFNKILKFSYSRWKFDIISLFNTIKSNLKLHLLHCLFICIHMQQKKKFSCFLSTVQSKIVYVSNLLLSLICYKLHFDQIFYTFFLFRQLFLVLITSFILYHRCRLFSGLRNSLWWYRGRTLTIVVIAVTMTTVAMGTRLVLRFICCKDIITES